MRRLSIIAHFPRLGGALLGALVTFGYASVADAAPKKKDPAPAKADPSPAAAPSAAAPAGGPDAATKKAAREAYGAGEKAYGAADYTTAYDHFKKAHDLIPTIHAEYWMAMALSFGNDVAAACDALQAVVDSPDASKLGDEKLGAAKAKLEQLKKTPGSVVVSSDPSGADVSLDGTAQPGITPTVLNVPPGPHHVGVALRGYEPYEADFTVKPGQKVDQTAQLKKKEEAVAALPPPEALKKKEEPPPAAPPPPPAEAKSNVPAYITLGVAVVGAGIGTAFGIQALSAKKDFDDHPTSSNADKAERDALIADMAFGVALTLGITGIVLLAADGSSEAAAQEHTAPRPARARLDLAPLVTSTTQGAAARLTF